MVFPLILWNIRQHRLLIHHRQVQVVHTVDLDPLVAPNILHNRSLRGAIVGWLVMYTDKEAVSVQCLEYDTHPMDNTQGDVRHLLLSQRRLICPP